MRPQPCRTTYASEENGMGDMVETNCLSCQESDVKMYVQVTSYGLGTLYLQIYMWLRNTNFYSGIMSMSYINEQNA